MNNFQLQLDFFHGTSLYHVLIKQTWIIHLSCVVWWEVKGPGPFPGCLTYCFVYFWINCLGPPNFDCLVCKVEWDCTPVGLLGEKTMDVRCLLLHLPYWKSISSLPYLLSLSFICCPLISSFQLLIPVIFLVGLHFLFWNIGRWYLPSSEAQGDSSDTVL